MTKIPAIGVSGQSATETPFCTVEKNRSDGARPQSSADSDWSTLAPPMSRLCVEPNIKPTLKAPLSDSPGSRGGSPAVASGSAVTADVPSIDSRAAIDRISDRPETLDNISPAEALQLLRAVVSAPESVATASDKTDAVRTLYYRVDAFVRPVLATAIEPGLLQMLTLAFRSWRIGNMQDSVRVTKPGMVLMGGGADVDEAFRWMIDRAGGGDMLSLRASEPWGFNEYVMGLGGLQSAETVLLQNRDAASDPALIDKVKHAEAIWFAGGDQSNYMRLWQDTPLAEAIDQAAQCGALVGGGNSAGLAILGEYYYTAENNSVDSPEALADPYSPRMTIGHNLQKFPSLRGIITDTHFSQRQRLGRLVTFLARLAAENKVWPARGIGIDEGTALVVDERGVGKVLGTGSVYLVDTSEKPSVCKPCAPLSIEHVRVRKLTAGEHFDVVHWVGTDGVTSELAVRKGVLVDPAEVAAAK